MENSEKSVSLMKCGAVLAGAAFAMGAMHSGVAHADSVKANANTASSAVAAKTSNVTPAPVAKSAANVGLASSAKASSATTVKSVASSNVKTVTPVVSSAKSSAPVKAATPAKQADDSFGVPAQSSSNNDGQNGLSGVKHVTSDTAKSSEVTSASVTYIDKNSNVVEVANDTVDYSSSPINQSTANKIAQSTVPAGYKVDKVYYSGSSEGLSDGIRMEHMMAIKAIVSQANEGLVLQTDANGSVSNGGLTLTPVGNQPSSSSNSAPVKVVINYQENGNTIATVNTTTTPNSPVNVSKSCPSGYEVSKDYTNPSSTVVNGVATFNVPVVKAQTTANNGQVTVTIQYTNNGQVIKTATETVPDKGQVDVVKDLPSGYEVQPGWSGSDMSTKDGKVTMVVPVVQANPSLQPDAGNTAGSSSVNNEVPAGDSGSSSSTSTPAGSTISGSSSSASGSTNANTPAGSTSSNGGSSSSAPAAGSNTSSSTGSSSTSSSTTPAGSTTGTSTPDTSVTGSTSSSSTSSPAATVNGDKSSSSASTPAADTITITVNGKSMTEKVGDDASLEKIAESLHIQTTTPGHYVYTIQENDGKSVVSVADPFSGTKWVAANNGLKINIVGFSKTSGTAPATQGTEDTDNRDIYPGEGILSNGHQQSSTVTDGTIQGVATTGQSTGSNNNVNGLAKAKAQAGLSAAQQANVARDEANGSAVAEDANASQAASAIANGASVQSQQEQEGSTSGLPDTGDTSVAAIAALSVMGALTGAGAFMKKRMAD